MDPTYSPTWFETFGRPDEAATAREVAFLTRVLPPAPAAVLDVPCGFGRHGLALAALGYRVTGVERDPAAAAEARTSGIEVHELDVRRLNELEETFDAVICMWASFGWFSDDANAAVFASMADKARRVLVLDVYEPAFFRPRQGAIDNHGVREVRRVEGDRLITTLDYRDGGRDVFEWRLYEPEELAALGAAVGLRIDTVCAGYDLSARPAGESPRVQYVFRRNT